MLIVGRLAKEFGEWPPLRVADEVYHYFPEGYLDQFTPEQLILGDLLIRNRLIAADNEAQEQAQKDAESKKKMPGVTRMVSAQERSEQLKAMRHDGEV